MNRAPASPTALLPNANGDTTAWSVSNTGGTGACDDEANEWRCVDEDPNDGDTTYLKSTAKTVTDSIENLGTVSFNGATVTSVVVNIWCRKTTSSTVAVRTLIKTHGTVYAGASDFDCPNSGTYGTASTPYSTNPFTLVAWTQADVDALQAGCRDNDATNREARCSEVRVDVYLSAQYAIETRFAWAAVPTAGTSWTLNVTCQRLNPGAENVLVQIGQGGSSPSSWKTVYTCSSDSDQSFNSYALNTTELNAGAPVIRFWDNQQGNDNAQGTLKLNVLRVDWAAAATAPGFPTPPTAPAFIGASISSPSPPAPQVLTGGTAVHNTSAVPGLSGDFHLRLPLPDLVISNLTGSPEYAENGETVVLSVQAQDVGEVSVQNVTVGLYDGAIGPTNLIGTVNVTLIGFSGNGSMNWSTASPGNHTVIALADSSGVILENNETNNAISFIVRVAAVSVGIPDLTVAFPGNVILNSSAVLNSSATLSVSVRNNGGASAYNFVVQVLDVTGNTTVVVGSFSVGALNPSAVVTQNLSWTPASSDFGLIKVVADSGAAITEQTKGNNVRVTSFPIEPSYSLCPVERLGDWDVYGDQEFYNTMICVEDGSVFIHDGATLGLHLTRLLLRFPLSSSHLRGIYVLGGVSGGHLLTDCQSSYGSPLPPVNEQACVRIYSQSSDYRYALQALSGSHVDIGANGATHVTQVDFLGGTGPREYNSGGLEIFTPFVTTNLLRIRWPEYHGLFVETGVILSTALSSINIVDVGSGSFGGMGVVVQQTSQLSMAGGNIYCSTMCSLMDGVYLWPSSTFSASGLSISGSLNFGIYDSQATLSVTAGSSVEGRVFVTLNWFRLGIGIYVDRAVGTTEIRDSSVRYVKVGINIVSSAPTGGVVISGNTVDINVGHTPYSGLKGIVVDSSTVTVVGNVVGVASGTENRKQDTGIELGNVQGSVTGNTVYQATRAGILTRSSPSGLTIAGGTIDDLTSTVDPVNPNSPTPCGVLATGASTTPNVGSVAVTGRATNSWPYPIGLCAQNGANPTMTGPGASPGAHVEYVFVGVYVNAASALIQGVRVERTVVGGNPRNFVLGVCVVANIAITPTVTIDGAQILNGLGVGVDVGACGNGDDLQPSTSWAKATIQNSVLHIDPSLRAAGFNPGNRGIWIHGTSTANILQNTIEYFDVEQIRITGASVTNPPQVIGNILRDLDYSSGSLPSNWQNMALIVAYYGGNIVVSGNQFHDGLWGLSGDPNGPNTLTLAIDDRSGQNLFDHNRRVGIGCSGTGTCAVTVTHNEFTRIRGVSIIAGIGTWTINRNNLHDNGGDGSDSTPVGAVYVVTSDSVQFVGNSVVNTRLVDGFGSGVGVRVDGSAAPVITPNLFQNNGIALDLNSGGPYEVTNNVPGAACTAQGLADCGFRGNDIGIRVENYAPRGPITGNVVDGTNLANTMGIVFEGLDLLVTYDNTWGNQVINNGFGIVARSMQPTGLLPIRFWVRGLTAATVLSGNGFALFAYLDAAARFGGLSSGDGNAITGNAWAAGVQQAPTNVSGNTFTDQTQGGIWIGGSSTYGFTDVTQNTITRSGARTCSSPPLSAEVKGIYVTSAGGTYANVFVRLNTVLRACFGIYTYNSDAGTSQGVHDNTITDVAQGVTIEGVSVSTFRNNVVQTIDWGYVVKNAQPTIRDHTGGLYGVTEFSKFGVYVTGATALPNVLNNKISTSVVPGGGVTPFGVYATGTTQQAPFSSNTISFTGPLSGAFVGVFLDHGVARVASNTLTAPGPVGSTFFGGQGIIAQDVTAAAAQSVIEGNVATNFWVGISVSGYVNARVGSVTLPNTVNGGGFRGIYSYASAGASLQVLYNLLQPSSTPGGVSYGLAANGGTIQGNDVTGYYYGIHITCCFETGGSLMVKENIVHGNSVGIIATNANGFSVIHNYIHDNVGSAIWLWSDASNAHLDHNNIFANNGGAQYGDQAADFGTGNAWDDGSIGNYWGGSNPPIPVIIPPNGIDHHPQTSPI